ncbi:MAG: hypothetical protein AAGN35_01465 [Bacteroidota bacterium]
MAKGQSDRIEQLDALGRDLYQHWCVQIGQMQPVSCAVLDSGSAWMPAVRNCLQDLIRMQAGWNRAWQEGQHLLDPGLPWHWLDLAHGKAKAETTQESPAITPRSPQAFPRPFAAPDLAPNPPRWRSPIPESGSQPAPNPHSVDQREARTTQSSPHPKDAPGEPPALPRMTIENDAVPPRNLPQVTPPQPPQLPASKSKTPKQKRPAKEAHQTPVMRPETDSPITGPESESPTPPQVSFGRLNDFAAALNRFSPPKTETIPPPDSPAASPVVPQVDSESSDHSTAKFAEARQEKIPPPPLPHPPANSNPKPALGPASNPSVPKREGEAFPAPEADAPQAKSPIPPAPLARPSAFTAPPESWSALEQQWSALQETPALPQTAAKRSTNSPPVTQRETSPPSPPDPVTVDSVESPLRQPAAPEAQSDPPTPPPPRIGRVQRKFETELPREMVAAARESRATELESLMQELTEQLQRDYKRYYGG